MKLSDFDFRIWNNNSKTLIKECKVIGNIHEKQKIIEENIKKISQKE